MIPVVDQQTIYKDYWKKLENKRGFAVRINNYKVFRSLAPKTSLLIKKAIKSGEGKNILIFGGDTAEKDLFIFLPKDIGKKIKTSIFVYDIRPDIPHEFIIAKNKYERVDFTYVVNADLAKFTHDENFNRDTRYCSAFQVLDYLEPQNLASFLKIIKDGISPSNFCVSLWLAAPDVDINREMNAKKEVDEINILLSKEGREKVLGLPSITFEEFTRSGSYLLPWTKEKKISYNLYPNYPGTSIYPISIIRLFKDKYDLKTFEVYRTSDSQYAREAFLFFQRKN